MTRNPRLAFWTALTLVPLALLSAIALYAASVHPASTHASFRGPSVSAGSELVPARSFEFTYSVHWAPTPVAQAGSAHLWIPVPDSDAYQDIRDVKIDSPISHTLGRDAEYLNQFAEFTPTAQQATAGFDATLRFTAVRREHKVALVPVANASSEVSSAAEPMLQRYLQPDKLVPLNATIAEMAREHTQGDTTPLEKARHLYDYVISTMRYDKTGEGWGHGDLVWACTSKRGNCTDFHSVFIGMARSEHIPARFEIGFSIPEGKSEGDIPGYHCWAEFYVQNIGWIPVDASEAWKNPAKHDYFFGAHDVDRIQFTTGRDLRLGSDQKGDLLNYFVYPYAEVNAQPTKNLQTHFSFRDLPSSAHGTAAD